MVHHSKNYQKVQYTKVFIGETCAAEKGVSLTGQGRRKSVFSTDKTQDLKQCIVALAVLRFGMQIKDVAQLVESYVQHNNYEKGEKVLKFKGRPGYPGPDW